MTKLDKSALRFAGENTDKARGTRAEKLAKTQRRRIFQPGNYCDQRGSREARNKTGIALEALLDTEATAITCKVIEKALEGDIAALRLCIERLLPVRRERPMAFELPKIETAADALKASSALLAACAEGTLSPREATEIMALIEINQDTGTDQDRDKTHRIGTHRIEKGAAAMTIRQLRARLDRLALSIGTMPGKDRYRDLRRREELRSRILSPGLAALEKGELLMIDALFQDEDQADRRRGELRYKQTLGAIKGRDPLTESEKQEVAEHDRRYPPLPREDHFKETIKAIRAAAEKYKRE